MIGFRRSSQDFSRHTDRPTKIGRQMKQSRNLSEPFQFDEGNSGIPIEATHRELEHRIHRSHISASMENLFSTVAPFTSQSIRIVLDDLTMIMDVESRLAKAETLVMVFMTDQLSTRVNTNYFVHSGSGHYFTLWIRILYRKLVRVSMLGCFHLRCLLSILVSIGRLNDQHVVFKS